MLRSGLVLDFTSLTDPTILFSSLVAFRQSHGILYTSETNVRYFVAMWPDDPGGLTLDVSESCALKEVCRRFELQSLAFEDWNLPLALRLLQHALNEGYLRVLPNPGSEVDPEWLRTFSTGAQIVSYKYRNHEVAVSAGGPWALRGDVNLALTNQWQISIANPSFQDAVAAGGSQFSSSATASLGKLVNEWHAADFADICHAIDSPHLFTSIASAARKLAEREKYEHELVTFLPRLATDIITRHVSSVVEMLYTIIRRRQKLNGRVTR